MHKNEHLHSNHDRNNLFDSNSTMHSKFASVKRHLSGTSTIFARLKNRSTAALDGKHVLYLTYICLRIGTLATSSIFPSM